MLKFNLENHVRKEFEKFLELFECSNSLLKDIDDFTFSDCKLHLPAESRPLSISELEPELSIDKHNRPTSTKWTARKDYYSYSAEQIVKICKKYNFRNILCLSEYSKSTDKVLKQRKFIEFYNLIFFTPESRNADEIARAMRQARSNVSYGLLLASSLTDFDPNKGGVFFTGLFDNEVVATCNFKLCRED